MMGLERGFVDQEFDRDRLSVGRNPLAVAHSKAAFLQQRARLAQEHAVLARSIGYRRHERFAEYLVGDVTVERFQQSELFR